MSVKPWSLVVLAVVAGALSSASPVAANWTTNSDATGRTFSGGAVGGALFTVVTTGAAAQGITCTTADVIGGLFGGGASGSNIAGLDLGWGGCKIAGQNAATKCATTDYDATSYDPSTSTTAGSLASVSCVFTKVGCGNSTSITGGISITGSAVGTYGNTSQALTISLWPSQNLTASWPGAGCLSGTSPGLAKLSNTSGTALKHSISGTFKPQITN
jgi:hypothetical protein